MKIKGSTIIICFMYASMVAYLPFCVWVRSEFGVWPPQELTFCIAALFIGETVSLARLKMAKEGTQMPKKDQNVFLSKIGVTGISDFEDETQNESAKHAQKGAINEPESKTRKS